MMIDAHPAIAIPPETNFSFFSPGARIPTSGAEFLQTVSGAPNWADFHLDFARLREALDSQEPFDLADALRNFYRLYAARFGKRRWGDKTPDYGFALDDIRRVLPEARFLHIIRDGRDAAASLRDLWFSPSRNYDELVRYWASRVRTIRQLGAGRPDYMEVRYEALVADTPAVLRQVCTFLNLAWSDEMLRYHLRAAERLQEHEGRFNPDGSILITKKQRIAQQAFVTLPPDATRIGAWRKIMEPDEVVCFVNEAGPLLDELGYR